MRHGRRDSTHATIRDGLRAIGASVRDTGDAGDDFVDLVVGWQRRTYLLEAKGPKGKESPGQTAARESWKGGPWVVVRSLDEALEAIGVNDGAQK